MECLSASIFDGFWWISGSKLEGKIEPRSNKDRFKKASENDEKAEQSKKSALWTSASNFFLSLYLPINFDKSIPHFQFVNSFSWFNKCVGSKLP